MPELEQGLSERTAYWQKRLRLQDWRITTCLVGMHDMEDTTDLGHCQFSIARVLSEVNILRKHIGLAPIDKNGYAVTEDRAHEHS